MGPIYFVFCRLYPSSPQPPPRLCLASTRARICKRLRIPEIDYKEYIPPGWELIPGLLKRFTNTGSGYEGQRLRVVGLSVCCLHYSLNGWIASCTVEVLHCIMYVLHILYDTEIVATVLLQISDIQYFKVLCLHTWRFRILLRTVAAGGAAVGMTTAEPRAGLFTAVTTDVTDITDVRLSEEGEAVWEAGLRRRDWAGTPLADLQLDRLWAILSYTKYQMFIILKNSLDLHPAVMLFSSLDFK